MAALMPERKTKLLRQAFIVVVVLNVSAIVLRVAMEPEIVQWPGAIASVVTPLVLLAFSLILIIWMTRRNTLLRHVALSAGTPVGLFLAVVEILHIVQETYVAVSTRAAAAITLTAMGTLLLGWGAAGFRSGRLSSSALPASLAGLWSGMTGMLLTMLFGFSQLYWSLPAIIRRNENSPDFIRSGWASLHAFSIIDMFDAGSKVLLAGTVLGAVLGAAGGLLARGTLKLFPPARPVTSVLSDPMGSQKSSK